MATLWLDVLDEAIQACTTHGAADLALTKIDLAPGWRRTAERNRMRLAEAGLRIPVLPVSAELRSRAAQTADRSVNAESGFPQLLGWLRAEVRTKADRLAPHSAAV